MLSEIKVGGQVYQVVDDPSLHYGNSFGECNTSTLTIKLDPNVPPNRKAGTFTHELVEAIDHEYDLKLDHHLICLIDLALLQVIQDNPGILDWEELMKPYSK